MPSAYMTLHLIRPSAYIPFHLIKPSEPKPTVTTCLGPFPHPTNLVWRYIGAFHPVVGEWIQFGLGTEPRCLKDYRDYKGLLWDTSAAYEAVQSSVEEIMSWLVRKEDTGSLRFQRNAVNKENGVGMTASLERSENGEREWH